MRISRLVGPSIGWANVQVRWIEAIHQARLFESVFESTLYVNDHVADPRKHIVCEYQAPLVHVIVVVRLHVAIEILE